MAFKKKWGNVDAPTNFENELKRVDEIFEDDYFPLPKKKMVRIRLFGDIVYPIGMHWIEIITPKQKKRLNIGAYCPNFNPETEKPDLDEGCKACKKDIRLAIKYVTQAIIRKLQEKGDPNPVRVIELPLSAVAKIVELQEANTVKGKNGKVKQFPLNHAKYGCDILIKYDPTKSGADMYLVSKEARTPLTKEERRYEEIDFTPLEEELSNKEAMVKKIEDLMKRLAKPKKDDNADDEYDDEYDDENEEWEESEIEDADWDDDSGDDDDWSDDEDESEDGEDVDDWEDDSSEDYDWGDEDEDEDGNWGDDDDEDEWEDIDDEEEEERKPKRRGKKKPKKKKGSKKKGSRKKKGSKKKGRRRKK